MPPYRLVCLLAAVVLVLAALAAPALGQGEIGYIRIGSTPGGALVYVDNVYRSTTPASGTTLAIEVPANVQHTLRLTKQGYLSYTTTFTVAAGQLRDVQMTLEAVPTLTALGTIGVASTPGGADVYIDGTYRGLTPTQDGSSLTEEVPAGQHIVSVQISGYTTFSTTIAVASNQRTDVQATLQLERSPGAVQVSTSPGGASVTLDGADPRTAPDTYQDVPAGTHTITATLDGYEPLSQSIMVMSGSTARATLTLTRVSSSVGSLHVSSAPAGADIYLNGIYRGPTPVTVGNLAAGSHSVLLRRAGYREWTGAATVVAGTTAELSVTLIAQPATVGSMEVISYPAGAAVYLDGSYYGQTNPSDALDIPAIAPGQHSLVLSLEGYYDYVTAVGVTAGAPTSVAATLEQKPGTNQFGQLAVSSSPAGAYVYLDGAYRGITPATLLLVQSGDRTVLLRATGYQDWTTSVPVTAGETAQVSATLAPVATATITAVPTVVATSASTTAVPTATRSGPVEGLALAGAALAGLLVIRARP